MEKQQGFIHTFEQLARQQPSRPALRDSTRQLSYGELASSASRLGEELVQTGITPGDIIALSVRPSADLVIAMLAVWHAGAAYLPLDLSFPTERRHYMLQHSKAKLLISDREEPDSPIPVRQINPLVQTEAPFGESRNLEAKPATEELAYVIYTSGTTGQPKGVAITHGNLAHYLQHARSTYDLPGQVHCFGVVTSVAFDMTVTSILYPIYAGHQLRLYDGGHNMLNLSAALSDPHVTALKCTPTHLSLLSKDQEHQARLQLLVVGGEALHQADMARVARLFPGVTIVNEYGPTEATVGCITYTLQAPAVSDTGLVPIGKAIAGMQALLLNEHGQEITYTPGTSSETGELYLAGAGLSPGYLHAPALTATRFSPRTDALQGRVYRTGDLAYYNPQGNLVYQGRTDQQVKLKGYRVELDEIARQLEELPEIDHAQALVRKQEGQQLLMACLIAPKSISYELLVSHLKKSLPYWMIPDQFVLVPHFPMALSGKIDLEQLEQLACESLMLSPVLQRKSHGLEPGGKAGKLLDIVARMAGIRVHLHDNLLEAGLDSLKLIRLTKALSQAYHQDLHISEVISQPTGAHLLSLLEGEEEEQLIFPLCHGSKGIIYCFPAAMGGITPFIELAAYLQDYTVYAFAFGKQEDLIEAYANAVLQHGQADYFIGYSGGGNLGFATARLLDQQDKGPGHLIMFDAFRKRFIPEGIPPEILQMKAEALEVISEEDQALFLDELSAYYDLVNLKLPDHEGSMVGAMTLICSQNREVFGDRNVGGAPFFQSWASASGQYQALPGAGQHHQMLQEPWLKQNITLVHELLLAKH